jgi:hypothetical protein
LEQGAPIALHVPADRLPNFRRGNSCRNEQSGDIIATGTPVGIGFKRPRCLKPGARIRIEVSSLGTLENPVL